MKFLIVFLAALAVANAASISTRSIADGFDMIFGAIPTDEIREAFAGCEGDPGIEALQEYFRGDEFHAAVQVIRDTQEVSDFFDELIAAEVNMDLLNFFFDLWGIPPVDGSSFISTKADCGGWPGFYAQVQVIFPVGNLVTVINQAYETYPEFADIFDRISASGALIQSLLDHEVVNPTLHHLITLEMGVQNVLDQVNLLFGWTLVLN